MFKRSEAYDNLNFRDVYVYVTDVFPTGTGYLLDVIWLLKRNNRAINFDTIVVKECALRDWSQHVARTTPHTLPEPY